MIEIGFAFNGSKFFNWAESAVIDRSKHTYYNSSSNMQHTSISHNLNYDIFSSISIKKYPHRIYFSS